MALPDRSLTQAQVETLWRSDRLALLTCGERHALVVAVISGYADAGDGDDVVFGRVHVRLRGIAAPEDRRGIVQPGGPEASASLAAAIGSEWVTCKLDGTTAGSSRRPVGRCFAGGRDLGRHQVRTGVARDCAAYSGGDYAGAEQAARASGHDLMPDLCPTRLLRTRQIDKTPLLQISVSNSANIRGALQPS